VSRRGRALRLFLSLLFFLSSLSCSSGLTVMSYNVENLFDDVDDGTEYPDYDPSRGSWTAESFALRVQTIAEVVRRSVPGGPDILLLQEVENGNALAALRDRGLAGMGYTHAVLVPKKSLAANVAVLSRLPVARVHAWQVGPFGGAVVRDVLEVELAAGGRTLHLLVNHWKSRIEGAEATEPSRQESARAVVRRTREILAADPMADVVVAGDFNEEPEDDATAVRGWRTALVQAGGEVPADARPWTIALSGDAGRLGVIDATLVLYDPWLELSPSMRGSAVFRGKWQTPDRILLSPGLFDRAGVSYRKGSFRAVRLPFLLLPDGSPRRWKGVRGPRGYSDHLPLLVTLDPGS
jgi:endonuclease/exonuclease/phosphatase family metal-dependent hydrolase